jgi:hypothetical protein
MNLHDFFKPEWKKLLLPVLMVIVFLFTIWRIYNYTAIMDDNICDLYRFLDVTLAIYKGDFVEIDNETVILNKTNQTITQQQMDEWEEQYERSASLAEDLGDDYRNTRILSAVFMFTDPFFPKPCEYGPTFRPAYFPETSCYWYISEEAYDCYAQFFSVYAEGSSVYAELTGMDGYNPVTTLTISGNVIFIFLEWYVFSSVVLGAFRKIASLVKKKR